MSARRLPLLLLAAGLLASTTAEARIGFGDPLEAYREREPEQLFLLEGYLRMRGALYGNLDLDRGPSPSTGKPLWPDGETPLDLTTGGDLRVRLEPTFFLGGDARFVLEVDVLDNLSLGQRPRGTPYKGVPGIVAGTAFQEPADALSRAFRVQSAYGEVALPFGVLAAGRMPSHFGLGIVANAGDDLDDDLNDRADRVAFVTPLFGHYVALGFDLASSRPALAAPLGATEPHRLSDQQRALSLALLRYHAPWELELYREAGWLVFDYGVAGSFAWQRRDTPDFYQDLADAFGATDRAQVRRDF